MAIFNSYVKLPEGIQEWDQEWDNLENAFGSPKNRLFCRTVINLTTLILFFLLRGLL
jgi:hypothetical protein